jgi:DNA-binding protein H-NS
VASKLKELQAQIKELQNQEKQVRKQELIEVITDIKAKIKEYGLTASDIGFKGLTKISKPKSPPKYRDPKTGSEWSGRGKAPLWISDAVKSGKSDDFLIAKPALDVSVSKPTAPKAASPKAPPTKKPSTSSPNKKAPSKKTTK